MERVRWIFLLKYQYNLAHTFLLNSIWIKFLIGWHDTFLSLIGIINENSTQKDRAGNSSTAAGTLPVWTTHIKAATAVTLKCTDCVHTGCKWNLLALLEWIWTLEDFLFTHFIRVWISVCMQVLKWFKCSGEGREFVERDYFVNAAPLYLLQKAQNIWQSRKSCVWIDLIL